MRLSRSACASPAFHPLFVLFVQPPEIEPDLHEPFIEIERRTVRRAGGLAVADFEGDVALQFVQIGPVRRAGLCLPQRRQRAGRIARRRPRLRGGDEHLDVFGRLGDQLFGEGQRFGGAVHGEQALHLAERGRGVGGIERARLAVAFQRLPVQAAAGIAVADQRGGLAPVRAALHGAHRLRHGEVHHSLAHVVARQGQRIVRPLGQAGGRGLGGGRGRLQLLEDVVEQPLVEREVAAQALGRDVGRDLRHDADCDRLVLQIDRQRELLRHVIRVQLERALGRAQRAVVVGEVRQREAEVVVGARVLRVSLDGPDEGVAGVGEALQLDEHEPHAVPRRRGGRLLRQHLAIRFERELEAAQMGEEQREVEAGADERRRKLQGFPKSLDRVFGIGLMRQHDADVVPRERVAGIDLRRLAVGRQRVRRPTRLMQHDAAFVPELGRVGDLMDQRLVQLQRIGEVALEEMDFRHRLAH